MYKKNIEFVYEQGIRKHNLQKDYEMLKDSKEKLKKYKKHLEIVFHLQ